MENLLKFYNIFLKDYGPQNWWPTTQEGDLKPKYTGGPKNDKQRFEVAIGAILSQNTSWKNVEKAILNLNRENLIDIQKLRKIPQKDLEKVIRPSGFFVQKAEKLKTFSEFIQNKKFENLTREQLLSLKGIGPETADSILLYACGKPEFVVDAYTRRIFGRLFSEREQKGKSFSASEEKSPKTNWNKYEEVKDFFETNLPKDVKLYQEYHALLVEHAKRFCKKEPECRGCPLLENCGFGKNLFLTKNRNKPAF